MRRAETSREKHVADEQGQAHSNVRAVRYPNIDGLIRRIKWDSDTLQLAWRPNMLLPN